MGCVSSDNNVENDKSVNTSSSERKNGSKMTDVAVSKVIPTIEEWKQFGSTLKKGRVLLPIGNDKEKEEFRDASLNYWEFCNDIVPSAIVECECEEDVVSIMKFLSSEKFQNNVEFRVKCGGHSYGGFNKVSNGVMIDVSTLNSVDVSNYLSNGTISAEPGVRGRDFVDFILKQKNRIKNSLLLPVGSCNIVAFGGYLTGGGISYLSSYLGLMCDYCIGARIVLHDGTVLDIKEDDENKEHQELLWAIKGSGGGNFGIITKYYLRPFNKNKHKQARAFNLHYHSNDKKENISKFLNGFKKLLNELPANVGFSPEIGFTDVGEEGLTMGINGIITNIGYGDKDPTQDIIDQINTAIGLTPIKPDKNNKKYDTDRYPLKSPGKVWKIYQEYMYPYLVPVDNKKDDADDNDSDSDDSDGETEYDHVECMLRFFSGNEKLSDMFEIMSRNGEDDNKEEVKKKENGEVVNRQAYDSSRLLIKLDDQVINDISTGFWEIENELANNEKGNISIGLAFEAMGRNIKLGDKNNEKTSFQSRDALSTMIVGVYWKESEHREKAYQYLKKFEDNVLKKVSNVKYVNYMENILGESTIEQYYPDKELFNRVRKVKSKYDPDNVFRFEFSIPPI